MLKLCRLMAAIFVGGRGHRIQFWRGRPKDYSNKVWSQLARQFQRRFLNIFPKGSYVKTTSAVGAHLGWREGSSDTILAGDYPRTIQTKFGPDWPWRRFLNIFPYGPMLKLCRLITVILYNSDRGPPKYYSNKDWSQLARQFQRRRF